LNIAHADGIDSTDTVARLNPVHREQEHGSFSSTCWRVLLVGK